MSLLGRTGSGETKESLLARVQAAGLEVETSSNTSTTIAYAANGLMLRQKETIETTEWRGLTMSAAKKLEEYDSDATTRTTYYKKIGTSDEYAAVALTTGSKTDVVPVREDEGDGWKAIKTVHTFSSDESAGWSTTRPSSATNTGIQVSYEKRKTLANQRTDAPIWATEEVTVTEFRFLTKAEASAKVTNETTSNATLTEYRHTDATVGDIPIYSWIYLMTGTEKTASARYIDAENGYTVTVVTRVLGAEGKTAGDWTLQP